MMDEIQDIEKAYLLGYGIQTYRRRSREPMKKAKERGLR
jgi:hypothetical protein